MKVSYFQSFSLDLTHIPSDADNGFKNKLKVTKTNKILWINIFSQLWFCSDRSMKVYSGLLVLCMVSSSWMSATQFMKATYHQSNSTKASPVQDENPTFSAPFLTCWFCVMWTIFFFPLHLISMTIYSCWDKKNKTSHVLEDALHKFREAGITIGKYESSFCDSSKCLICRSSSFAQLLVLFSLCDH